MLIYLLCGTNLGFLEEAMPFQEKLLLAPRDKTTKLAESSEAIVH
jgi:hypothetical protein